MTEKYLFKLTTNFSVQMYIIHSNRKNKTIISDTISKVEIYFIDYMSEKEREKNR